MSVFDVLQERGFIAQVSHEDEIREMLEKEKGFDCHEPSASKRLETKKLIAELSETIPQVEANLFRATENVVLNKVLGYKIHGEKHTFLEDY